MIPSLAEAALAMSRSVELSIVAKATWRASSCSWHAAPTHTCSRLAPASNQYSLKMR